MFGEFTRESHTYRTILKKKLTETVKKSQRN